MRTYGLSPRTDFRGRGTGCCLGNEDCGDIEGTRTREAGGVGSVRRLSTHSCHYENAHG